MTPSDLQIQMAIRSTLTCPTTTTTTM